MQNIADSCNQFPNNVPDGVWASFVLILAFLVVWIVSKLTAKLKLSRWRLTKEAKKDFDTGEYRETICKEIIRQNGDIRELAILSDSSLMFYKENYNTDKMVATAVLRHYR